MKRRLGKVYSVNFILMTLPAEHSAGHSDYPGPEERNKRKFSLRLHAAHSRQIVPLHAIRNIMLVGMNEWIK